MMPCAKNPLICSFSRFNTIPACERQTDARTLAYTALCSASRGKNYNDAASYSAVKEFRRYVQPFWHNIAYRNVTDRRTDKNNIPIPRFAKQNKCPSKTWAVHKILFLRRCCSVISVAMLTYVVVLGYWEEKEETFTNLLSRRNGSCRFQPLIHQLDQCRWNNLR